ncbi:MAG: BlaI/MecI/CopY family transcriptional regulator [Vicinamibacterales bacterium]
MRPPLTDLEHDVMDAVWTAGSASVETVHAAVAERRPLKEATIRTILRRLEQKGYLAHHAEGRAYVYRALEPQQGLAARAVRQIIDRFCRGSVEELVSGMVDAKLLNRTELDALGDLLRHHRQAATKPARKKP